MYDYETPEGYGDYAYIYVFSPAESGLVSGDSYTYVPIQVQDGSFVMRAWAGANTVLAKSGAVDTWGTIQIYDARSRLFFDVPTSTFNLFNTGTAVIPEKEYVSNSAIRFDLAATSF